ncbi:MAG TPA: hypothetical protein VGE74_02835 [Gemmata sp.]
MNQAQLVFAVLLSWCCPMHGGLANARADDVSLEGLPSYWFVLEPAYKVDPYIATAGRLRGLGREKAITLLRAGAKDPKQPDDTVIALCRLLFTAKPRGEFRRPRLGAPGGLGGTDRTDWALEPIEVIDGVPFLVVDGYDIGGRPESAEDYLEYCLKECDWGATEFKPKMVAEKQKALDKLLASPKWKKPLTADEKAYLAAQIK